MVFFSGLLPDLKERDTEKGLNGSRKEKQGENTSPQERTKKKGSAPPQYSGKLPKTSHTLQRVII